MSPPVPALDAVTAALPSIAEQNQLIAQAQADYKAKRRVPRIPARLDAAVARIEMDLFPKLNLLKAALAGTTNALAKAVPNAAVRRDLATAITATETERQQCEATAAALIGRVAALLRLIGPPTMPGLPGHEPKPAPYEPPIKGGIGSGGGGGGGSTPAPTPTSAPAPPGKPTPTPPGKPAPTPPPPPVAIKRSDFVRMDFGSRPCLFGTAARVLRNNHPTATAIVTVQKLDMGPGSLRIPAYDTYEVGPGVRALDIGCEFQTPGVSQKFTFTISAMSTK